MLIFKFNRSKFKYNYEKAAIKYDQNQDINKSIDKNKKYVKFDENNQKQWNFLITKKIMINLTF